MTDVIVRLIYSLPMSSLTVSSPQNFPEEMAVVSIAHQVEVVRYVNWPRSLAVNHMHSQDQRSSRT